MKEIILFGSTGSVGRSVLDIARQYPGKFRIKALTGNRNVRLLSEQVKEFRPDTVVIADESSYKDFIRGGISASTDVLCGEEGCLEASSLEADVYFMAISGTAALKPLLEILKKGGTVALASKEPVVSAGELMMRMVSRTGARILPVDSEHSAIMQCLEGRTVKDLRKLYITGSGGSLRGMTAEEMSRVSMEDVLSHPKWDMGRKITVDSATLMNKGLEVIEARWLFDINADKIDVVIHPDAVVHAMAEYLDGTMTASMFSPDMRFPVLRALAWPDIQETSLPRLDLPELGRLSFETPDRNLFPALDLAYESLNLGGTVPAVLNAANETAVSLFLAGKIEYSDIIKIVAGVVARHDKKPLLCFEDVYDAESWAQEEVLGVC